MVKSQGPGAASRRSPVPPLHEYFVITHEFQFEFRICPRASGLVTFTHIIQVNKLVHGVADDGILGHAV
jgi:hypothetical protein